MEIILEYLKSVLFGIVQGITEWLPISSTGAPDSAEPIYPSDGSGGSGPESGIL